MKFKLLHVLLFLCIATGYTQSFIENGLTYNITDTNLNEVEVVGTTTTGNLVIPETVIFVDLNFSITAIGDSAFLNQQLTSVSIPNTIRSIGEAAFSNNALTNVVIPNSVTSIGRNAFSNNNISAVVLPDDLTVLSKQVFTSNALTSIDLPSGLTTIDNNALRNNQLSEITIPSGVTSIGLFAFKDNNLETVISENTMPPSVAGSSFSNRNTIDLVVPTGTSDAYLNADWTGFASITSGITVGDLIYEITATNPNEVAVVGGITTGNLVIPDTVTINAEDFTVTSIANSALTNKNLTSVVLPNTLTTTGLAAFSTNAITSVFLPEGITIIRKQSFQFNQLSSIDLPSTTTKVDNNAFRDNQLTEVILPANVNTVGIQAFANNPITEVTSLNTNPPSIAGSSFSNRNTIDLVVPIGTTQAYLNADWTGFASIDDDVIAIGGTFASGDFLFKITSVSPNEVAVVDLINPITDVVIPNIAVELSGGDSFSVTEIGFGAFFGNNLTSVVIPNSVTSIGNGAFAINELTSVTIPNSVTSVGDIAFSNNNLTSVVIPNSVTEIRAGAFANNPLTEVISEGLVPASITTGTNDTFGNRSVIDLTVPNGLTQDYLEADWINFASITEDGIAIGDTFTSGDFLFEVTSVGPNEVAVIDLINPITDAVIPNIAIEPSGVDSFSVTSVGNLAFRNNALTSVVIPNSVTSIGNFAFFINNLTSVVIPNSVTNIENSAFEFNELMSVTIPNSVTSIGSGAFFRNQLSSITIPNSVTTIGNEAFANNPLTEVISEGLVPATITTGVKDTFGDRSGIDLFIPEGTTQAYLDADWTGFASINDGEIAVGDTFESGDFLFEVTSVGPNEVAVVDLVSAITDIVIPSSVFESSGVVSFSVTSVGDEAFLQDGLTSVSIPNSVITIGEFSFNTNALTSIAIGTSVTTIERAAFANNLLASITIPDTVTVLGDQVFAFNPITTVVFGTSITSIGAKVFEGNPDITTVTSLSVTPALLPGDAFDDRDAIDLFIPEGTLESYLAAEWTDFASIDDGGVAVGDTFEAGDFLYEITSLEPNEVAVVDLVADITVIEIPSGVSDTENEFVVTSVGEFAFSESGITSVVMPTTILTIGDAAFLDNVLSSVSIPNSVVSIGVASFAKNFLENVTIPASMISIGNEAFGKNPLTQVISLGTEPATIFGDTFGDRFLITLTIPEGTLEAYIEKEWTGFLTTIENGFAVGDTFESGDFLFEVTSIGPNEVAVIDLISAITSIEIPSIVLGTSSTSDNDSGVEFSVTAIGDGAFIERNISQVFIPDSVISIGIEAFAANVLGRLRLGNNVTTIEKAAFDKNNLTSIFIPSSVTFIGAVAFNNNPLTAVTSEGVDPATISEDTFGERSEIDLTIPLGTFEAYIEANWTGFKTFTETEIDSANRSSHSDNEIEELLVRSKAPEVSLRMSNESVLSIQATEARIKEYTIYNMFGIQVAQGSDGTVSLAHVSRGIYIVHIHFFDAEMIVKKVIK